MLVLKKLYNLLLLTILLVIIDWSKQTQTNSKCPEEFQCDDTECISHMKVCDGKFDCSDHSDEKKCDIKGVNKCPIPEIRNGKYEIIGNDEYIAGQPIPHLATVTFTCTNTNYKLTKRYNTVKCLQGNYSEEIPNCISICIPEFPNTIDVECELDGIKQDCRKNVLEGTTAYMKCKPNYIDNNPEISKTICSNGTWSLPPKQCTSQYSCSPRFSSAIDIICEINGVMQDCTKEVPDGTISYMNCKPNYVDLKEPGPSVAVCSKGSWNIPPKQCIPDCDQIITEGKTFVINGKNADRGAFPWHVAIYRQKPEEPIKYICGGSIISVKTVISAAHCFTVPSSGELYPISQFSLAAGKHNSKWDASEDTYYVQKKKIIKIEIPTDVYFGDVSNHAGDLALVVVEDTFILTNRIKPVCIDWNSEHIDQQLTDGTLGKVAGWGSTTGNPDASISLKELKLPYVKRSECAKIVPKNFIRFVTTDKYCAGYTNGSSVCVGDSGGGMVFPQEDAEKIKYYLQGIVSVGPVKENHCDNHQLGVYTEVNKYIKFIRKIEESNRIAHILETHLHPIYISRDVPEIRSKGCVVPIIQNGKIVVPDNDYTPGSLIKESSSIIVECNPGFRKSFNNFPKCIAGIWNPEIPKCEPFKSCSSPSILNGKFDVLNNPGYHVGNPIPNLSTVNFTCNENYVLTTAYTSVICVDGVYSGLLPSCIPITCPARFSNLTDVNCELNGVKQDCSKAVLAGTVATMKCKSDEETYPEPATATCSHGSWDVPLKECISVCPGSHMISEESIQDCGEISLNATEEIDFVKRGDFPWHVGIFRKEPKKPIIFLCGGSIISEKIVLSVAYCFTVNQMAKLYPISELHVAAGKQYNNWDSPKDEGFVQKRKICKLNIPSTYSGVSSYYEGNIAVVVVDKPFEFSNVVKPICVDWNSEYADQQIKDGTLGVIPGWGFDYAKSPILKYITVPIVGLIRCYKTVPFVLKTYVTEDKYCAGSTNGSNLCSVDHGGGMVFSYEKFRKKRYVIQGIKSHFVRTDNFCKNDAMFTFTKVVDYIGFIRNVTSLNQMH